MTLRLWHPLDELDLLVGASFPAADEDSLRRCAAAWAAAGDELARQLPAAGAAGVKVSALLGGGSGEAFERLWHRFAASDGGLVTELAHQCARLAAACEHAAVAVEYAKIEYLLALTLLATMIASLLA